MPRVEFTFYGGAREFAKYKGPEALLHGAAETGKTISALWKLHLCALKYPKASIVIARKTLSSTYSTVLQTYLNKVLGNTVRVDPYGGAKPEWFEYPNGAKIWIAGLDKAGKILSSEHDVIYVNQVEELTIDDWEVLTTRTTGRAGNMPYSQTIGDCNPSYPAHWMYSRESLKTFYSKHEENPALFDQRTGEITEQGRRTLAVLDALTGVRKQRLRYGRPAQAEGAVYDAWDDSIHRPYSADVPTIKRWIGAQDWGYTHAGVFGLWGLDGDGRMYLVRQIYQTQRTIDWWVEQVKAIQGEIGRLECVPCDPSEPAYIADYKRAGINAIPADNAVLPGINAVIKRLSECRLYMVRDSLKHIDESLSEEKKPTRVEDEMPMYVWADKATKEVPVKENDHGVDMTRYAVMYVDNKRGWAMGPSRG